LINTEFEIRTFAYPNTYIAPPLIASPSVKLQFVIVAVVPVET